MSFFIKGAVFLSSTFALLQETQHPDLYSEHEVSLTLTLIVQVAQELGYGTFFNSVEPTDLMLQLTPVANT